MPGQDHDRLAGGLADETAIQRTVESLTAKNMEATVVESGGEALEILKELVPPGSEVFSAPQRPWIPSATQDFSTKTPATRTFTN